MIVRLGGSVWRYVHPANDMAHFIVFPDNWVQKCRTMPQNVQRMKNLIGGNNKMINQEKPRLKCVSEYKTTHGMPVTFSTVYHAVWNNDVTLMNGKEWDFLEKL